MITNLNVTNAGRNTAYSIELPDDTDDTFIKQLAAEMVGVERDAFTNFVVDRIDQIAYIRPKVPFGQAEIVKSREEIREELRTGILQMLAIARESATLTLEIINDLDSVFSKSPDAK